MVAETDEGAVPCVATADWGYLRLRKAAYDTAELTRWAQWIGDRSWTDGYVFFKHEDEGAGPKMAAQFTAALTG